MTNIAIEHGFFKWDNQLFLWPFSIAMLVITRGYNGNRPHSNSVFVDVCSWNDLNKKTTNTIGS